MSYKLEVTSRLDIPKELAKVDNNGFWTAAANEWWKLITPFTPMDSGSLFESVKISPKKIHYYQPYATPVYKGRHITFRTDKHPFATAEWDKAAIPTQQDKLIDFLQDYIKIKGVK